MGPKSSTQKSSTSLRIPLPSSTDQTEKPFQCWEEYLKTLQGSTLRTITIDLVQANMAYDAERSPTAMQFGENLFALIEKNQSSLKRLNFTSGNLFCGEDRAEKVQRRRWEVLKLVQRKSSKLETLVLSKLEVKDSLGFEEFLQGLSTGKHVLESLDLSGTSLSYTHCTHLSDFIKKNQTLRSLNLYACYVDDKAAEKIADALLVNRRLEELFLGGNQFRQKGAQKIADALWVNTTLKGISLQCGSDTQEIAHFIHRLTDINKNLWSIFKIVYRSPVLLILPREVFAIIVVFLKQLQVLI